MTFSSLPDSMTVPPHCNLGLSLVEHPSILSRHYHQANYVTETPSHKSQTFQGTLSVDQLYTEGNFYIVWIHPSLSTAPISI